MSFSTWELIRASGLTSYLLLFVSVIAGLSMGLKIASAKFNQMLNTTHQTAGWLALIFGFFHSLLLSIDKFAPFTLAEIFIPFTAKENAILNGLGTISLYFIMILFLSADFMKKVGPKAWNIIHRFALPCFLFLSIHGILLGTDSQEIWGILLYASTLAIVSIIFVLKLFVVKGKEKVVRA